MNVMIKFLSEDDKFSFFDLKQQNIKLTSFSWKLVRIYCKR